MRSLHALLQGCFDRVVPFKNHFVADLHRPVEDIVKRTLKNVNVRVCSRPQDQVDQWVDLFLDLVKRHEVSGLRAFSRG